MSRIPQIWVVDDDPELRQLLKEYLEREGFSVRVFADGQDVPRRLARERPDLLVLDLMLPREDGLTLCRRLRDQGDDIPIIILTAKNDPIDRVIGIESGADDYVGKPFLPRELCARIQAVLRRRQTLPVATLTDAAGTNQTKSSVSCSNANNNQCTASSTPTIPQIQIIS